MDIHEALAKAVAAVDDASPPLPEDLRAAAFPVILRFLLDSPSTALVAQTPFSPTVPDSTSAVGRLAGKVRLPVESLADVFDVSGEGVSLHVASSRIPTTKSKATREIALLVVAARQGAGLDEGWTSVAPVREALQNYNRYDLSNFSAHLRACDDVFNIRGKGPSAELRLTQPGWEAATALIRSMAGSAA